MIKCNLPKGVHVTSYKRRRLGKWESVREHCRRYPRR